MAAHPAYASQYSVAAQEVRARRLEVSQTVRWLGILVAVIMVCLLYVGLTSRLAVLATEVQAKRDYKAQLERQNELLTIQTVQLSDPQRIAEEAADMGMVPAIEVEYLYIAQ